VRQFEHAGQRWRAEVTGEHRPAQAIDSHGVRFDCLSARGQPTVVGSIHTPDLLHVTDAELRAALASALAKREE